VPGGRRVLALTAPPAARRIAVLRALPGLGDMLCAVPALRALRSTYRDATITLIGLPSAAWLPDVYPAVVDEVLPLEGWPGVPEAVGPRAAASATLARARARRFDLALQLHGSGATTNLLLGLLGARRHAGSRPSRAVPPPVPGTFVPYEEHGHEIHRQLRVLEAVDVVPVGDRIGWDREVGPPPAPLRPLASDGTPWLVVHPGASVRSRRADAGVFVAVGRTVAAQGWRVAVTGGVPEQGLTRSVAAAIGPAAIDLGGATDLRSLAAAVSGAQGVVCNDTGVSHLAVALETPSAVVFTSAGLERWAPLNRQRHVPVRAAAALASPVLVVEALDAAVRCARGAPA
jgi:ADP-heptose:LPS heptosyltransferase